MTDNKGYPYAQYPPQQGFAQGGGYPPQPAYGPAGQQGYSGYGAPPPQPGFVFPNAGPQHSTYNVNEEVGGPKPYASGPVGGGGNYGDISGIDFSEKSIRMAFIRKVYALLSIQMLATTGLIALFNLHDGVKGFVKQNFAFVIVVYIFAIVVLLALACCENLRRKAPHNFILLALFTLAYGTVIGVITTQYDFGDILKAAGVTVVVCVALTLFSFQTKWDFTMMGGALFVCLIVFTLFGFIAAFFSYGSTLRLIMACIGTVLFSVYLVYDTQIMIGGNHKYSISPEEYVFASLNIYMDVIMIFIYLLQIFGSKD